jgi:hypothetical protein
MAHSLALRDAAEEMIDEGRPGNPALAPFTTGAWGIMRRLRLERESMA